MSTAAVSTSPILTRQTIRQAGIYSGVTLVIMTVLVWAPLRVVYPALIDTGEITVTGVGSVLWLVTVMASGVAFVAGVVLSLGKSTPTAAPAIGCTAAAVVFAVVSLNVPIW
jgi:hypothetical protein